MTARKKREKREPLSTMPLLDQIELRARRAIEHTEVHSARVCRECGHALALKHVVADLVAQADGVFDALLHAETAMDLALIGFDREAIEHSLSVVRSAISRRVSRPRAAGKGK